MPGKHTRQNQAAHTDASAEVALDPRLKLAGRALTVGGKLAPVAVRLWRARAVIRIVISVLMLAIPVLLRVRALRATAAQERDQLPPSYRPLRPIVVDDRALEAAGRKIATFAIGAPSLNGLCRAGASARSRGNA